MMLMLCWSCLLINPISLLVGFISRYLELLWKFGLRSFKLMQASLLVVLSTQSSIFSLVAVSLSPFRILEVVQWLIVL